MQDPAEGHLERGSNIPKIQTRVENEHFARSKQEIGRPGRVGPSDPQKMYKIERLKKLEATVLWHGGIA